MLWRALVTRRIWRNHERVVNLLRQAQPSSGERDCVDVVWTLSWTRPSCKITIVGGGAELRGMVSFSPRASLEELHGALDEPHLPSRSILRFLSPEEYLAEVGAE